MSFPSSLGSGLPDLLQVGEVTVVLVLIILLGAANIIGAAETEMAARRQRILYVVAMPLLVGFVMIVLRRLAPYV